VHVVQRGENLFRIALQYDLFAEDLAEANGITDSDSIAVGQRLIIPLAAESFQQPLTHTVSAGETLARIASAYEKTIADLMTLNGLTSANLIYTGQVLTIEAGEPEDDPEPSPTAVTDNQPTPIPAAPSSSAVRHSFSRYGDPSENFVHIVKSGETLSAIELRYNQTINALAQANNLLNPSLLSIGQRLTVPGIQLPRLTQKLPDVVTAFTIGPLVVEAGRSGRVELLTSEPVTVGGQFLGRELRVIEREEGKRHNILIGIPMFTAMNVYPLTLEMQDTAGQSMTIAATLQVISGGYGRQKITIDDSELLAPAVEEEEIALLARLTEPFTPERSWSDSLSLPAAAPINAVFGTLRSYNGSPFDRYHGGVDFAGAPGTSVLAAADGKVVMVDRLHIRGNTTLIDHGWGLYTLYAHQDETLVQLGAVVTSGQVIGTIGSTGRSTGPHLHWEAWLNGVNIDPMQWVQEVFP
jgi:murein DD-endopeptidase MepM/ murein hydrolase activator NlpD